MQSFRALRQVQNEIGTHRKLSFFELFYAIIHHLCIAMGKEDPKRTAADGRDCYSSYNSPDSKATCFEQKV